ncbi:hypothetical protein B0H11DRAFT_2191316 [Mycena galericulata]|nr:hypothetical protein B0H11DRAFT_2191316 [Mycena galericulata]
MYGKTLKRKPFVSIPKMASRRGSSSDAPPPGSSLATDTFALCVQTKYQRECWTKWGAKFAGLDTHNTTHYQGVSLAVRTRLCPPSRLSDSLRALQHAVDVVLAETEFTDAEVLSARKKVAPNERSGWQSTQQVMGVPPSTQMPHTYDPAPLWLDPRLQAPAPTNLIVPGPSTIPPAPYPPLLPRTLTNIFWVSLGRAHWMVTLPLKYASKTRLSHSRRVGILKPLFSPSPPVLRRPRSDVTISGMMGGDQSGDLNVTLSFDQVWTLAFNS